MGEGAGEITFAKKAMAKLGYTASAVVALLGSQCAPEPDCYGLKIYSS